MQTCSKCWTLELWSGDSLIQTLGLHGVILGQPFCSLFSEINFNYHGKGPALDLSSSTTTKHALCLAQARVRTPKLFLGTNGTERPIRSPPRWYSYQDRNFINSEVRYLLKEGIIRPSNSPWCSQILIVKTGPKPRICIDYSTTINKITKVAAYPSPMIEEIVNKLAQYRKFSKFDLKAAYNQVAIPEKDIAKTAFQANQQKFEYTRIPFGLTNAVAAFQRIMDDIIREENLKDTYVYLDDVTIGGRDQIQHDLNVQRLT